MSCHGYNIMICKNCGHTIMMAGGEYYHIDKGFGRTCKTCGCKSPEPKEEEKK